MHSVSTDAAVPRPAALTTDVSAHGWRFEVALFAAAYLAYVASRWLFTGSPEAAQANAAWIWDLERAAGIAVEADVQRGFASGPAGWIAGNVYLAAQMAVLPAALVLAYRRSRPMYRRLRSTVIATWMLSVPIFALFPVAPPRLAELGAGFADTVSERGAVALTGASTVFYNPFAAVPSLHVGFAFALGAAGVALGRHRSTRLVAGLWGPVVALVVVATANHYILDAVAGLVVTVVGFAVGTRLVPRLEHASHAAARRWRQRARRHRRVPLTGSRLGAHVS